MQKDGVLGIFVIGAIGLFTVAAIYQLGKAPTLTTATQTAYSNTLTNIFKG